MPPRWLAAFKLGLFTLALLPLARLVLAGAFDFWGGLGANPVEFVTRSTGTWTLVMLCVTLSISPLRRLTGQAWLLRVRRMLGLFTFFYASLHVLTYVWFDQYFDWIAMGRDLLKRPFITMGFLAFVLMLPLALTSTNAMMRRLGRFWGRLHRAVYAVAVAAILHYAWHKAGKNDYSEVAMYAAVLTALLGYRLVDRLRHLREARATPRR